MFTWICPQCGREVPPAYNECPDCAQKQKAEASSGPDYPSSEPPASGPPGPAQSTPRAVAPRPLAPAAQPYAAAPRTAPASGIRLPAWLMSIVAALAFLALGAAAYFGIQRFGGTGQAAAPAPTLENARAAGKTHPLQKYIEVVGVRLTELPKKKAEARFVVVNHSGAEIADLAANVNLWARTAKSDEEAVGTFSFKLPSLGPYESKEVTAPLTTKLRVYELPDWQNLNAEIQITSP